MVALILNIWVLIGLVAVWRKYHGVQKYFYVNYRSNFMRRHYMIPVVLFIVGFLGGPLALIMTSMKVCSYPNWYFKMPEDAEV